MKKGYKKTALGDIPVEWEVKKLNDVSFFSNGKGHEQVIDENGSFIVVNSKFVSTNGKVRKHSNENLCPLNKDDITMVMSDIPNGKAIAKCFLIEEDNKYTLNQRICSIKVFEEHSVKFMYYLLNRNRYFLAFDNGVGQTNLRKDEVLNCPIPIPPLKEQQKIAEILSTVDSKLDLIDSKIKETQELKKGLMQNLLTKGIGHSKFKDSPLGEIPLDWEVVKLGDVVSVKVGRDLQEKKYADEKNEIYKYPIYSNTVSNYGLYGYYNFKEYEGNSVTVIGRGVGVGMAFHREGAFGAIGRLLVLFPSHNLNHIFLSYFINFSLKFFSESSAIPQLTGAQLIKYSIKYPPLQEQQKIATILSTVDEKIEVLKSKKEEYSELKKGLMQVLLTGRVRVAV